MLIRCLELHLCFCSWSVIQWSGEAGRSCTMPFPAVLTMNNAYYVNAILNRVSLFLTKKWDELTALMLIRAKPVIYLLVSLSGWQHYYLEERHDDSETNPLFVPLTHIPEEKAKHIEGRHTTMKSHLDVVSNLLSDTSSMKSPPESVRLLQSEIQAEIHASAQIRLELQSLCKINRKYKTFIDAMQLKLVDMSAKEA